MVVAQAQLGRRDPPMNEWPGNTGGPERVALASGDERDYFTYEEHLRAWKEDWDDFDFNHRKRQRSRTMRHGFEFAQILISGRMGRWKSVHATDEARQYFRRGHPLFHNGYQLPGWELDDIEIFDIVEVVPKYSVVVMDEAHTVLETAMGRSVALRMFQFLESGLRKKECRLYLPTAKARMIYAPIRFNCSEIRQPRTVQVKVNRPNRRWEKGEKIRAAEKPENFVYACDVWDDYPYERAEENRQRQRTTAPGLYGELGPQDKTLVRSGERVRRAMLVNDSFKPVKPAIAMLVDRDQIKDRARARNEGHIPGQVGGDEATVAAAIAAALSDWRGTPYIKAPEIAARAGMSHQRVSGIISRSLGLTTVRGKGYDVDDLNRAFEAQYQLEET